MKKTIYLLYPDLNDDTTFHVTTSKVAAIIYFAALKIEGPFENLLRAGFIVERQPVELMK
jgi:hypothetical protein